MTTLSLSHAAYLTDAQPMTCMMGFVYSRQTHLMMSPCVGFAYKQHAVVHMSHILSTARPQQQQSAAM